MLDFEDLNVSLPPIGEMFFDAVWEGKVYSKGRPRFSGKSGSVYTPPNTYKFEKAIVEWLAEKDLEPLDHPCRIEIVLYDQIPKSANKVTRWLMEAGLMFSTIGDLDNRAKSILDASNGLLYSDDRLVSQLEITRQYDEDFSGFRLTVKRSGYSAAELDKIARELKDEHFGN